MLSSIPLGIRIRHARPFARILPFLSSIRARRQQERAHLGPSNRRGLEHAALKAAELDHGRLILASSRQHDRGLFALVSLEHGEHGAGGADKCRVSHHEGKTRLARRSVNQDRGKLDGAVQVCRVDLGAVAVAAA
eukprot:scaffold9921_cov112-Isochrysis_galbana.AAC.4